MLSHSRSMEVFIRSGELVDLAGQNDGTMASMIGGSDVYEDCPNNVLMVPMMASDGSEHRSVRGKR